MSTVRLPHPSGAVAALLAALLFGAGTPLAKALLHSVSPWLMAGLLYLGSGLGLWAWRRVVRAPAVRLPPAERRWFAAAVLCGGVLGPVLLMAALARMPAASASLLLNGEAVFTAMLAWWVFREPVDGRIALGMAAIAAGAVVLSWPSEALLADGVPALLVLAACAAWALDNNLTRKVSLSDASWIASVKGLVAGGVNLALALAMGAPWPAWPAVAGALALGLAAYGISLVLFVVGLRQLGTARAGAYFSVAPFFGAVLALAGGEPLTPSLAVAGCLMALGVWLHLTEHHEHDHAHDAQAHSHSHVHDAHHQHAHEVEPAPGARHSHWHTHQPLVHRHPHFPDAHHLHPH
jgi:drug/metabolite transporter (DMT)-like permease